MNDKEITKMVMMRIAPITRPSLDKLIADLLPACDPSTGSELMLQPGEFLIKPKL